MRGRRCRTKLALGVDAKCERAPPLTSLLLFLIRVYQATLSRLLLAILGPVCRFEPSCSRYAAACIQIHGPLRGSLLSVKRLCKCHPFHPGGFDPPPPRSSRETGRSLSSPEGAQHDQRPPLGPRSLGQTGNERLAAGPADQR